MSGDTISREEFDSLRSELSEIKEQLAALLASKTAPAGEVVLDEETIAALSAAVAAYLGKRATIKFVRRIATEDDPWSVRGKAAVAGSHGMPRKQGW
ncbi:MAG: hypothetical protein MUC92_11040 [Fimbriimonadaceae bacterium]|jgi:hypothetical protein|nr:hypothetical protein [Fimbriimonadaceae bacterium]